MEPNRFLFKLTAILFQYLFLIFVFIPIIYLAHLIKYNFNTEAIVFIRVLFFAIAFAMPFAVANAFAFAKFENNDLTYYLKCRQYHSVVIDEKASTLLKNTVDHLESKPFWKLIKQDECTAHFKVKNILIFDDVTISTHRNSDTQTLLTISSIPKLRILFLDFGRNYQNIITVLLATKSNT